MLALCTDLALRMTTIDMTKPENRDRFHMAQCISALRIEVNTGMKHSRGSILKLVQRVYGVKAKTKKGALEEMKKLYKETTGYEYGSH